MFVEKRTFSSYLDRLKEEVEEMIAKKCGLNFLSPFLTPKEGHFRGIKVKTKHQQNV